MSAIKSKYKKTKTYGRIRYILERNLESPHFAKDTKDGISFRWNIRRGDWDNGNFSEEYLKTVFPKNLYKLMTFKNIELSTQNTFRILVDLRGAE
jgi:hypothetical protein